MSLTTRKREQKLRRLAREYEDSGYDVIVGPTVEHVPTFLAEFDPQLIATRDDESVVVEVGPMSAFAADDRIQQLAATIDAHDGWRLDFVVTKSSDEAFREDDESVGAHSAMLEGRLTEAGRLCEGGSNEAAMLLAWSAAEGMLRLAASRAGLPAEKTPIGASIRQLFSLGLIGKATYDLLISRMQTRNQLAHGELRGTVTRSEVESFIEAVRETYFELVNNDFPTEARPFDRDSLKAFENLLNDPKTKEADFQRFFETHPEFLVKWGDLQTYSQVRLGTDYVTDFVLTNPSLNSTAIVELEPPSAKVVVGGDRRPRLSAAAYHGREQLLQFREWLRKPANRKMVEESRDVNLTEPRLILVIGRGEGLKDSAVAAAQEPVEIVTYDELLQFAVDSAKLQKGRITKR